MFDSISDTTTIDTSTKAGQDQKKLKDDLNQFLQLLVSQLENQDPLDPMDSSEFTNQLVQFSSVEQQIQANANLEKQIVAQQNTQAATMVNYLGTVVEAKGDEFFMLNNQAVATYTLPAGVETNTLTVQDASGKTMFTVKGETDVGLHRIGWDGSKNDGTVAPDGAYTLVVGAEDAYGNAIPVEQTVFGYVTATGVKDGNVSVTMGDVETDMTNIVSVERPIVASAAPAP